MLRAPVTAHLELEQAVQRRVMLVSAIVALVYGLCARLFFGPWDGFTGEQPRTGFLATTFHLMSVAFIFGVPFSIRRASTGCRRRSIATRACGAIS